MTTSIWVTPDGTVLEREGMHAHTMALADSGIGHSHDSAFKAGYCRGVLSGSEMSLQWGGVLTCQQRTAVQSLTDEYEHFYIAEAEDGYDPEGHTRTGMISRNSSNFTRLFNTALRGKHGKWGY